jgi:hypothetical protein
MGDYLITKVGPSLENAPVARGVFLGEGEGKKGRIPPKEEVVFRCKIYSCFIMNFTFCTKRRQKQSFLKQF